MHAHHVDGPVCENLEYTPESSRSAVPAFCLPLRCRHGIVRVRKWELAVTVGYRRWL
jgi:hypothetical protein